LLDLLETEGTGCICFSPLAQGLLTSKYLDGEIPESSRASKNHFLKPASITPQLLKKLNSLNLVAKERGVTLSELAILWILRDMRNTSVLTGASSPAQLRENLAALSQPPLCEEELINIETIIKMS
jgi:L-glyceraldehyde 3-phosphate reductase